MHPPDVEPAIEDLPQTLDHPSVLQDAPPAAETSGPRPDAVSRIDRAQFPERLALVSTRELRVLCNSTYRLLDTAHPSLEARERYARLIEELESRERTAELRGEADDARETFRDNALFSRFELYSEGVMAAYLQYEMRGGDIRLLHTVIDRRFRRMRLEPVLMQALLVNAHRRRLAVVPFCPDAQEFLRENPQFLPLVPARQRRRLKLIAFPQNTAVVQEGRP